jgi:preprotein translocase subunit SecA
MTGTALESAPELWDIYQLPFVSIPENKPCQRKVYKTRVFADQESKWRAILDEITQLHEGGRPILAGTRSVEASENLASRLTRTGCSYKLLNAVRHREEAQIVAQAGEEGAITIATNMAGRGTDILLGRGVAASGGLHVIATEAHESGRIDRQLFGRCARQGDPGSARLFVSMEDELMRRYVPQPVRRAIKMQLGRKLLSARWAAVTALRLGQQKAQRIAFRRRRSVLRMDTWLEDSLSFGHKDIA